MIFGKKYLFKTLGELPLCVLSKGAPLLARCVQSPAETCPWDFKNFLPSLSTTLDRLSFLLPECLTCSDFRTFNVEL